MEKERFKFILVVQTRDHSFKELCHQIGISRPTGYKWWQKYSEARDPQVLANPSRDTNRVHSKIRYDQEQLIIDYRHSRKSFTSTSLRFSETQARPLVQGTPSA